MEENNKMKFLKLLRQNARGIKREVIKKMDTSSFSHSQINLILHLSENKGRPLSLLSKIVQVQKSNLTTLVDSLEKIGVVVRVRDDIDRRIIHLKLTPKGVKVKKQLLSEYEKNLDRILCDVTDEELDNAIKDLEIIKNKIWS